MKINFLTDPVFAEIINKYTKFQLFKHVCWSANPEINEYCRNALVKLATADGTAWPQVTKNTHVITLGDIVSQVGHHPFENGDTVHLQVAKLDDDKVYGGLNTHAGVHSPGHGCKSLKLQLGKLGKSITITVKYNESDIQQYYKIQDFDDENIIKNKVVDAIKKLTGVSDVDIIDEDICVDESKEREAGEAKSDQHLTTDDKVDKVDNVTRLNYLALIPFFSPADGSKLTFNNTEYTVTRIPLLQPSIWRLERDQVFAYSFQPTQPASGQPAYLSFMGTTYPACQGFFSTLVADVSPFGNIGSYLFGKKTKNNIRKSLDKLNDQGYKVIVSGISLGGALVLRCKELMQSKTNSNSAESKASAESKNRYVPIHAPGNTKWIRILQFLGFILIILPILIIRSICAVIYHLISKPGNQQIRVNQQTPGQIYSRNYSPIRIFGIASLITWSTFILYSLYSQKILINISVFANMTDLQMLGTCIGLSSAAILTMAIIALQIGTLYKPLQVVGCQNQNIFQTRQQDPTSGGTPPARPHQWGNPTSKTPPVGEPHQQDPTSGGTPPARPHQWGNPTSEEPRQRGNPTSEEPRQRGNPTSGGTPPAGTPPSARGSP